MYSNDPKTSPDTPEVSVKVLAGKRALVTGSSRGIGKATALAFLNDGYRVGLGGRRRDALEDTIKEAGDKASNAIAVSTDVTDPSAVINLFSKTRDKFGRVDVVFNINRLKMFLFNHSVHKIKYF